MTIFTYIFRSVLHIAFIQFFIGIVHAQNDTIKLLKRATIDTSDQKMNMDAVYNRPFLNAGKLPIAIGGYLETNTQYTQTDGINNGLSFQARRLTLFISSTITKKIKFLSELEFENGGKEINIEFAAMDIELHPLLNLRGGIVMNPIGAFNQNHDGPRWDFIDRPISAITIIPSTLSNAGLGLHGKYFKKNWIIGYETYLTNGFDDNIISNVDNRTSLGAAKDKPFRFEENNSGSPLFTGKFAIRNRRIGELGISYMSGIYNKWQIDGVRIDNKRSTNIMAIDFNTSLLKNRLSITGEVVKVFVDIPETYTQQYGRQQFGAYIDIIGTVLQRKMLAWEKAKFNIGIRLEYADYNQGKFRETGTSIGDHIWAVVPTLAFRPVGSTVIRFNYRYEQKKDLLANPAALTGGIQLGFSTYF